MAAGEVVWVGVEQIGERDGRIALYSDGIFAAAAAAGRIARDYPSPISERAQKIIEVLTQQGAMFFAQLHAAIGGGFPQETQEALWELVWAGQISNDTFHPLRTLLRSNESRHQRTARAEGPPGSPEFLRLLRSRAGGAGQAQGRWSLVRQRISEPLNLTQWSANIAQQLLVRHGLVMREMAITENIPRGYQTIYPALKTMEDSGWIRRGMFVAGLGAAQFAMPSAVDMLRGLRIEPQTPEAVFLAATDPANPYGTILAWPRTEIAEQGIGSHGMSRTSGAGVILMNGSLAAYLRRRNPAIRVFLTGWGARTFASGAGVGQEIGRIGNSATSEADRAIDRGNRRGPGKRAFPGTISGGCRIREYCVGISNAATAAQAMATAVVEDEESAEQSSQETKMPEGDTIYRAARTLNRALAGGMVKSFQTMLPKLARVDV